MSSGLWSIESSFDVFISTQVVKCVARRTILMLNKHLLSSITLTPLPTPCNTSCLRFYKSEMKFYSEYDIGIADVSLCNWAGTKKSFFSVFDLWSLPSDHLATKTTIAGSPRGNRKRDCAVLSKWTVLMHLWGLTIWRTESPVAT
jgi:hypothetical protein